MLFRSHGGVVKSNDVVGLGHLRRADGVIGDDDVAVGGAAAHLGAVAREVGDVFLSGLASCLLYTSRCV